jgi:hypothetical protein
MRLRRVLVWGLIVSGQRSVEVCSIPSLEVFRVGRGASRLGPAPLSWEMKPKPSWLVTGLGRGDLITIGDGPLVGAPGRVLSTDPASDMAHVETQVSGQNGEPRRATAVVCLSLLRRAPDEH